MACSLYRCETWSLTLNETGWGCLRVLRKTYGAKREEVTADRRKLLSEKLDYLYCSLNIIWVIKSRRDLEDLDTDGRTLQWLFDRYAGKALNVFIWLRTQRSGDLLWTGRWNFRCHEVQEISGLTEELVACPEGFCCMVFDIWNVMQHLLWNVLNQHSVLFLVSSTCYTHYNIQIQRMTVQMYKGVQPLLRSQQALSGS